MRGFLKPLHALLPSRLAVSTGASRRRVVHVTTAHPHTDNRILRKECTALAVAGFDVWLVAVAPRSYQTRGVTVAALPHRTGRLRRMLLGPVDAWRVLRAVRPALVHVHDPELVPLAILWRLLHRRPVVFDAHEDLPRQVAGKAYLPRVLRPAVARLAAGVERAADLMLDAVVAATPSIARNFTRAPVTLVQNFPWLSDFPTPAPWPASGPPTLCYVGAISAERGGLEMLEVVQRSPQAPKLVMAGSASAGMSKAISADVSGRVRYEGLIAVERVPELISASHLGLVLFHPLPNHLECQPTKLFEYMAAGRPFVASHFDAWIDLLGRFDCGYFVDPLDVAALAAVIAQVEACPSAAEARGSRGRAALVEHFTFENEARRLVSTTERLLAA